DYEITTRDSIIMEEQPGKQVPAVDTALQDTRPPANGEKLIEKITDTATRAGTNIVLKNINFYGGRHVFLPESYPALYELLHAMQTIPTLEIEIQGHICCLDNPGDGLDIDTGEPNLSYNRARAVYEYLVEHGIDGNRMKYRGFGHRYPIILVEETEEERTINRRVEIRILKK
ncbi:MAG TPA: OmpA family protein, partial [Chitinophagaceae bacterium]